MRIKKILAPTDLSELSRTAVRYAVETALAEDAEVLVYNVISEDGEWFGKDDALNPAKALVPKQNVRLDEFVKASCAEFIGKARIRQAVEVGIPYRAIVKKAEEENVDMIIMSTHGRTGLDHFMLGSVTEKVVAHAPCPVLSMRPAES